MIANNNTGTNLYMELNARSFANVCLFRDLYTRINLNSHILPGSPRFNKSMMFLASAVHLYKKQPFQMNASLFTAPDVLQINAHQSLQIVLNCLCTIRISSLKDMY